MRRQILPAILAMVVFTLLLGFAYPLVVTGIGQTAFGHEADGSLIERDGVVVGSKLLGQNFAADVYFWPRPSAAGAAGYDGASSSGSNLGPTNPDFLATVAERVAGYREAHGLPEAADVPADAVTASGSGLDPHISVANARIQAGRVAKARNLAVTDVLLMVDDHTEESILGFLGNRAVNVLELNLALDDLA
ncbi:MAG TPA: K(+)-transporting ATPase subunit C [Acidimicrobiales bacterium]|nr:K(+)-transporting ATPase subunit C [Acidimicrobiales bacterium]